MKVSTFFIIVLLVMNGITLNLALSNRDLLETTFDMFDIISHVYEPQPKETK